MKAIHFFSRRSWFDVAGAMATMQPDAAVNEFWGGAGSKAAEKAGKAACGGKRRAVKAIAGGLRRVIGKEAAKIFGWPIGLAATVLDYASSPSNAWPFRQGPVPGLITDDPFWWKHRGSNARLRQSYARPDVHGAIGSEDAMVQFSTSRVVRT